MRAAIRAIESHLPEYVLSTEQLARELPDWSIEKLDGKTGIHARHIAAEDEYASDLAAAAAERLFASGACEPRDIDYLILCTQSPDYLVPTTACMLQDRLGMPTTAGALDINLGSSGFVYGLGVANGLIESGQATRILLITSDTYSKFIDSNDRSVRAIFGDAGAATLVTGVELEQPSIGPFVYGTDGRGSGNLIARASGTRGSRQVQGSQAGAGTSRSASLFMDGLEIFNFTLAVVPKLVKDLLQKSGRSADDVDLFVFHQANQQILEHLRRRLKIPAERFYVYLSDCGNTASCSIPIALQHAMTEGRLSEGSLVMLAGYGPGYSWGGCFVRWLSSR